MYQQYFNMTEMPFALLPDTSFFYESDSYKEALNVLLVAIRSGEGFVKVTGEVGTGKTMLCRKLLNCLDDDKLCDRLHTQSIFVAKSVTHGAGR